MTYRPAAALMALALSAPAIAATDDLAAWGAATATISANDKLVVWLEAQGRFSDDASRLGQLLLRPGLGYRLSPNETVFLGYAHVTTRPAGRAMTTEHRIWQQLSFRAAGDGKGLTLTGRSRFEQRFLEGSDDMGLRFRQLLRLTAPLDGGVRAVAWNETFLALNDTNWGARDGLDRMRNFAGIAIAARKGVSIEPGYMNEYINLAAGDRMNHIASLTINTSF